MNFFFFSLCIWLTTLHSFQLHYDYASHVKRLYAIHHDQKGQESGRKSSLLRQNKFTGARVSSSVIPAKPEDKWGRFLTKFKQTSSKRGSRLQSQALSASSSVLIKESEFIPNSASDNSTSPYSRSSSSSVLINENGGFRCPHYPYCPSCVYTSSVKELTTTPIMKRAKLFMKSLDIPFNIEIPSPSSSLIHWRNVVKLAVQPMSKWGGLQFGLYKENTHELIPIPNCIAHHPKINEVSEFVRLSAIKAGVKGYVSSSMGSEPSGKRNIKSYSATGELRYIQLSVERSSGKVQISLVWNAANFKDCSLSLLRLVKLLKQRSDLIHSVYINFHTNSLTNSIFNYHEKSWKLLWGSLPYIKDKIGNANFYFLPSMFKQSNVDFFEKSIIPYIDRYIIKDSNIAELYSGNGIIGLNVLSKVKESLLLSDSNPFINKVFNKGVTSLPEVRFMLFFIVLLLLLLTFFVIVLDCFCFFCRNKEIRFSLIVLLLMMQ
jgi:23S rRNA (uracil1939-C5)-methyltransferase